MPEVNLSNHVPGPVVLRPPETPEERSHRLAEETKRNAFVRHILYGSAALAAVSAVVAMVGPTDVRSFAANTWWTLLGAGVGYALGKLDRR